LITHINGKLEIAGNGYYLSKNAPSGDKMHIANQTSALECTHHFDKCIDFNLERTVNGTHNRLLNRSTSNHINIENELGYVVQHHRFNVECAMGIRKRLIIL
jgi:hypothetical protein